MPQNETTELTKDQKEFKTNNFDLLRLLAATQVIVDHYFQHLNIPIGKFSKQILDLFPGVTIFFVISGYLISASLERNNNLAIYFKNRALRIFPGLWGLMLVTIVVFSLTGVNFFNKQTITWLPAQLVAIIYTPHFLLNYGFGSYNGSLWTLPLELQFYIVLPICYFLAPKNKVNYWFYALLVVFIGLAILCGFENVTDNFTDFAPKLINYSFVPRFYLFLTGVVLQRLRIYKSNFVYNRAHFWLIAYVVFSLVLSAFINPIIFLTIKNLFLALCTLSLAYTLPKTATKLLKGNDISYGIYIYHGLIITVLVQEKLIALQNLYFILPVTFIMAYLSWVAIERPFIKRKEKTIRSTV